MKIPKIQGPKVRAPKIQPPPFLNNLYRDMRDRRLLLPAVALVVALIAVPMVLSSSSATTPPPPAPAAAASGSGHEAATSPAVLTEELGVTNYRKRLEQIKSKNPFRLHFTSQPKGAKSDTGSSGEASSTTTSSSTATSPTTSSTPIPTTPTTSDTPSTSPSDTGGSAPPQKPPEPTLYAFRVNVAFGIPGDVTRREGIKQGKFLPSQTKPMVAFIGGSEDLKHALFLVSDDVSSVSGDGRCVPGRNDCNLLRLTVGDEAKLTYAPEGDRAYKLKLLGIDLAPIKAKAAAKQGKRASLSALVSGG
jgi:hypothetical protein